MIAMAVDAAKEATCERSRPRPITTMAMPSARMPRIEILRVRAKKFPRLKKPLRKTEKRTIRIAHIAKTASVWVGFRACAADPPLTFHPPDFNSLSGKDQTGRIKKSRDVSETLPIQAKIR